MAAVICSGRDMSRKKITKVYSCLSYKGNKMGTIIAMNLWISNCGPIVAFSFQRFRQYSLNFLYLTFTYLI